MATDPMEVKRQNELRRKAADCLHALARKIENGTYEMVTLEIENEFDRDEGGPAHQVLEPRFTGRQTFRMLYDTKQPQQPRRR